jgi:crotonobetainyl-CoA:carnitine CoA-transferase CaiB-like acyl-CoA transferase
MWPAGRTADGAPQLSATYLADKMAAAMVAQATLAALYQRDRTGRAQRVDVAMMDAVAYLDFPDGFANRTFVEDQPVEARNLHAAGVRPVATQDGWIVVVPVTADQVRRTCVAAGHPEWADDLLSRADGRAMNDELLRRLDPITGNRRTDAWLTTFADADVPAAPCLTIDEHLADAQIIHNHLYAEYDWPGVGRVRQVRYPARFGEWGDLCPTGAPPATPSRSTSKRSGKATEPDTRKVGRA